VDAELLFKRSLAIREQALGPDHPDVALSLNNLAHLSLDLGDDERALDFIRRSVFISRSRALRTGGQGEGRANEQQSKRYQFIFHVGSALSMPGPTQRSSLVAEAFDSLQLAHATSAGAAISRMAARFAAGDDKLAIQIRQRQDASRRWQVLDETLIKAVSQPPDKRNKERETLLRRELAAIDKRIQKIDAELAKSFPQYAGLTSPRPVPLADIQSLLGPEEALLTFAISWNYKTKKNDQTHVFIITKTGQKAYTVDVSQEYLQEAVAELRAATDLSQSGSIKDLPEFDTEIAHELYQKLLGPAEETLSSIKHLFVVPTGPLQSLPLGVLVTASPKGKGYKNTEWLAKRLAITTLPSVSSLKALRGFAQKGKARNAFTGFGDPELEGGSGTTKGIRIASLFRGAIANVDEVRELASLPGTADELKQIAKYLGADEDDIYLGAQATETLVKTLPLNQSKVLAFATHGLVSGELTGLSEPALVLTPPDKGTEEDDGLLTASEIAQLKLNADWVILSACNTASGDKPGAEGLSGLAKAFFYAGARALLVSHWPVESTAATQLTTTMFDELKANPKIGRSEALRRSMMTLAANDNKPHYAHPAFWAPFVVVGEGGR
jgi:CHAT domain-containing protein